MTYTFACGHDDRLWKWIDHHKEMIPGKIFTVYGGVYPIIKPDFLIGVDYTSNNKYIGDGHLIPQLAKTLPDDAEHVIYASHDSLIIDDEFFYKSLCHMIENKVDILAPSLHTAQIGSYTYDNKPVLTGIICLVFFTAKAFRWLGDNWLKPDRRLVSEEVEFYETPHRVGFKVAQNPFIIPDLFTCRHYEELRREGSAIHPHKVWL